jgi:hypothetical protein
VVKELHCVSNGRVKKEIKNTECFIEKNAEGSVPLCKGIFGSSLVLVVEDKIHDL